MYSLKQLWDSIKFISAVPDISVFYRSVQNLDHESYICFEPDMDLTRHEANFKIFISPHVKKYDNFINNASSVVIKTAVVADTSVLQR